MGLSSFSGPDQAKVDLGNAWPLRSTLRTTAALEQTSIVILENPWPSRVRLALELRDLQHRFHGEMARAGFCQHGKLWKKVA
eukprot:4064607-Pyramimonas_sp.AAC.1